MHATIRTACVTVLLLAASIGGVQAGVVVYDAANVAGNQWRYDYEVTNDNVAQPLTWFTVFFALGSYAGVCDGDGITGLCGVEPLTPVHWYAFVAQPDPLLPDNGFFDVSTPGTGIARGQTLRGFSVVFDWLGEGTPGSQPFDFIDFDPANPLESGVTTPRAPTSVPEPGTLSLLALGLFGLALRSRPFAARLARPPGTAGRNGRPLLCRLGA